MPPEEGHWLLLVLSPEERAPSTGLAQLQYIEQTRAALTCGHWKNEFCGGCFSACGYPCPGGGTPLARRESISAPSSNVLEQLL